MGATLGLVNNDTIALCQVLFLGNEPLTLTLAQSPNTFVNELVCLVRREDI